MASALTKRSRVRPQRKSAPFPLQSEGKRSDRHRKNPPPSPHQSSITSARARGHRNTTCNCLRRFPPISGDAARASPVLATRGKQGREMTKEELLQFEGLVMEILPDARYRVQLDAGHTVIVYTAGRMKKNRIKTLAGDVVTVEWSPYDLNKGRMIFRHKDERAGTGNRPPQRNTFRRR